MRNGKSSQAEQKRSANISINSDADQLLLTATEAKDIDNVLNALANKARVDATGNNNQTALNTACELDQKEIIEILLEHKADPTIINTLTRKTPLYWTAANLNFEAFQQLVIHFKKNNNNDISALISAMYNLSSERLNPMQIAFLQQDLTKKSIFILSILEGRLFDPNFINELLREVFIRTDIQPFKEPLNSTKLAELTLKLIFAGLPYQFIMKILHADPSDSDDINHFKIKLCNIILALPTDTKEQKLHKLNMLTIALDKATPLGKLFYVRRKSHSSVSIKRGKLKKLSNAKKELLTVLRKNSEYKEVDLHADGSGSDDEGDDLLHHKEQKEKERQAHQASSTSSTSSSVPANGSHANGFLTGNRMVVFHGDIAKKDKKERKAKKKSVASDDTDPQSIFARSASMWGTRRRSAASSDSSNSAQANGASNTSLSNSGGGAFE